MLFDSVGIYEVPKWNVGLFTPHSAAELDELDALLFPNPPQIPGFIVRDILRLSAENGWVIHRALDQMLNGQDRTEAILPQLKMPLLLVWGSEDHITPENYGEAMHRLAPQSELEVIAGCGHMAPGQCTDLIGPKVVGFLER